MGLLTEDMSFHSNIPGPMDITVAVVYSVFGVCSLFGNSTLLYISYKKKHLLKPAEYFIINLSVSDLGLTLSLYPLAITSSFSHRWLYGKTVCSVYAFCGMLFGLCSLTTLTLQSMVCFVKVCFPLYAKLSYACNSRLLPESCLSLRKMLESSLGLSTSLDLSAPAGQVTFSVPAGPPRRNKSNQFKSLHGQLLIACAWVYALLFACSPLIHWGEYGPEPYGTACCIDWRLSNQHTSARTYTVALFVFCYILPCCVIVASYTGILITVQASRKTMKQHASRQTHRNSIQTIIVKLSVVVCIGFFVAWTPYAVVSMWAAFGRIENIPPLAFAVPAMFAKSSTVYNPIIYLMLRPNCRRMMCRDLGTLFELCLKGCLCLKRHAKCCSKPKIKVRLCTAHPQSNLPSSISAAHSPVVTIKDYSCQRCEDSFEHFRLYPRICGIANPAANGDSSKDQLSQAHTQVSESKMAIINTSTTNTLNVHLEMAQRNTKQAWS